MAQALVGISRAPSRAGAPSTGSCARKNKQPIHLADGKLGQCMCADRVWVGAVVCETVGRVVVRPDSRHLHVVGLGYE